MNNHKSFEQSLRSASPFAPLLRPIKSEIHKGCTGKAHGCGTRKNSRSTRSSVSDSSSEFSPGPSVERESAQRIIGGRLGSNESLQKGLRRTESVKSNKSGSGSGKNGVDSKPPWHNVYTAKLTGLADGGLPRIEATERVIKKIPRKVSIHWQDLYAKALAQKQYGGTYIRYCPSSSSDAKATIIDHDQVKVNLGSFDSFLLRSMDTRFQLLGELTLRNGM